MISKPVRFSTGTFVFALTFALLFLVPTIASVSDVYARDKEPKPYIVPGDGDGVGGYKGYEFEEPPSETSTGAPASLIQLPKDSVIWFYFYCDSPWMSNFCVILK